MKCAISSYTRVLLDYNSIAVLASIERRLCQFAADITTMKLELLLCTVLLAVLAVPGHSQLPTKKWWEHANVYQIYPRSFADSNGDGIGDLPGITSRLQHLADIGIDTIWMSPLFQSPLKDFGYDVSNFYAIHDEYGTMEDFDRFVARAKELGIGVLLDFVPNHSSSEHEWFVQSENSVEPYTDYYVWHDGTRDAQGNPVRPNNWVCALECSLHSRYWY